MERTEHMTTTQKNTKALVRYLAELAVLAIVVFVITRCIIGIAVVNGTSMGPTLNNGDLVVFSRIGYTLERGDIVAFAPGTEHGLFIKRVIALPGDTVSIDSIEHKVYLNGEELAEDYLGSVTDYGGIAETWPQSVPDGHIFAMGDNRQASFDCRNPEVGFVPDSDIVGKELFRIGNLGWLTGPAQSIAQ